MRKIEFHFGVALLATMFATVSPAASVRQIPWHKSPHGELLKKIDAMPTPKGIPVNKTLDKHFKKRMASVTDKQRNGFQTLRQDMDLVEPDVENRGLSYLKILEYIHHNEK